MILCRLPYFFLFSDAPRPSETYLASFFNQCKPRKRDFQQLSTFLQMIKGGYFLRPWNQLTRDERVYDDQIIILGEASNGSDLEGLEPLAEAGYKYVSIMASKAELTEDNIHKFFYRIQDENLIEVDRLEADKRVEEHAIRMAKLEEELERDKPEYISKI